VNSADFSLNRERWEGPITRQSFLSEKSTLSRNIARGVILGFEQFVATAGMWKRGTKEQTRLRQGKAAHFPTPWNHLEAGILFGMQLPLLIFREKSVQGGVFDEGVTDVFIHSVPDGNITGANLEALREVMLKWSSKVREHYYRIGSALTTA
jgi:hypothetical protein